ncbi:MAG TPA: tRNA (adenosine(37)-N6)-threonylcarbamoyltransferase complex ATPase subunit type 1 TsaE [Ferruginibacter sp.]|nr:tRNA (adenosine(37)-N6)-threonylcarbamoyltransferase complex ATPase subunit type 1 TsaE [Ferruginibacter sp.]
MEVNFTLDTIQEAATAILQSNSSCSVFAFHGELGAGKTTFIHALCKALNVVDTITSPTFSIINQYKTKSGQTIYHMDFYRIKDEAEAINAGVEDCLYSGDKCFVEWPEKAAGILPEKTLHITITLAQDNTRKLKLNL